MANNSVGFIETWGLTSCIAAADAAVKSANVKLIGYEYAKGGGLCTVKVEGNVGACKAAILAGKKAAESVKGTHQGTKSILLKARPADGIVDKMIKHRENVGGDQAIAEGYRPKGESRMPVLVSHWKPKDEAVTEAPITEAPVTSEVEDLKDEEAEETSDSDEDDPDGSEIVVDMAPQTAEPEAEESVEAEETAEVVAPEAEEPAEVVAPEAEPEEETEEPVVDDTPVTEESVKEEIPEIEETAVEEIPEAVKSETENQEIVEDPAPAKKPRKSTSGTRRSGRSRKKKTDK